MGVDLGARMDLGVLTSEEADNAPVALALMATSSTDSSNSENNSSWDETLTGPLYENFKREKAYKAVPPPTGNKVIIEDWVDSDDEEVPLGVSEIKKQTILKSETSSENKSPRSKDSFGQRSRRRGTLVQRCTVRSKMSQAVPSQSTASAFYQNTARPNVSKAVLSQSTARPYFSQRPRVFARVKKESTAGTQAVLPQTKGEKGSVVTKEELKDHAIIDSGCSGSMTGDKDKLSDFKEYKGGYVAFGNDPTNEVQTSGGDEGNLDLYGLTREVLRLKKQNTKQAAQILRLKTKLKILVKKGRKKVSDGSTSLNEVDVNSDSQMMDD
ncbi:hypothetical protein Tco_0560949 [Tanacetum coccineum]